MIRVGLMTQVSETEAPAESLWLQIEVYVDCSRISDGAGEVADALRATANRIEKGERVGEIVDSTGAEVGWFDATPEDAELKT